MLQRHWLVLGIAVALLEGMPVEAQDAERQEAGRAAARLNKEGVELQRVGELRAAASLFRQAIELNRKAYPAAAYPHGHNSLVVCWKNLGFVLTGLEEHQDAALALDESLSVARRLHAQGQLPGGETALAGTLNMLGDLHCRMSSYRQAFLAYEESLALNRKLYSKETHPDGHPSLAGGLFWMGRVYREMGSPLRALPYYEEALAMLQRLYPKDRYPQGRSDLAAALGKVGDTLSLLGAPASALTFQEEAFHMSMRLLPNEADPKGWRPRATALGNMAESYSRAGVYDRALPLFEQSLALARKAFPEERFPNGSFGMGLLLTNFAATLHDAGEYERGLEMMRAANAMFHGLFPPDRFPQGHVDIVITSKLLAAQLHNMGRQQEARAAYETALTNARNYQSRLMAISAEADALQMAREFIYDTRDGYLSVTPPGPATDPDVYRQVWFTKSFMTRLLERRHIGARLAAASAGSDGGPAAQWRELSSVRRQLDQALQTTATNPERAKKLEDLTRRKEQLERDLAAAVPELEADRLRDRQVPADLAKQLGPRTVFVDFLLWTHFHQDPVWKGKKGQRQTAKYAAFVVTADKPPVRVDLGEAAPIAAAVKAWREEIATGQPQPPSDAARPERPAARVRRLVWEPIAQLIAPTVQTIYLSPDGDLNRVPFSALPGGQPGRILLEEHALACVPHGPFLLERLLRPASRIDEQAQVLTLGGVSYGPVNTGAQIAPWPPLPGTLSEVSHVGRFAADVGRVVALTGNQASVATLLRELPKARYAHVATHGWFRGNELEEEEKHLWAMYQKQGKYQFAKDSVLVRSGAVQRNPLALVGLVLAGANQPKPSADWSAAKKDGAEASSLVTGETIVTLPLENLRMCVLSACETGLGDYAGGEGIQGLQRAFHLAGCPNVVSSLWKVNDAATAALMAKFYHELWINKKPPIEALRVAQLTIYRHPELIPDLAGERGAPRLREAVKTAIAPLRGTADARLWAAFVLSGLGR